MKEQVINISNLHLVYTLFFILIAGILSIIHSLKLEKSLFIGTIRTFVQLFILGYVLKYIFNLNHQLLVLGLFLLMTLFAVWTIYSRVNEKKINFFFPVYLSMALNFFVVAFFVTGIIVDVDPWWAPRYFIPIGGMVIGNSMNAIAIALERLLSDLKSKRAEIEMKLCLGADYKESSMMIVRNAMQSGMIPSINAMMSVGMVFIPGMMTGQILAGNSPVVAIKYQIVVMIMLTGSTAIGTLCAVLIVRKLCFRDGVRLILDQQ